MQSKEEKWLLEEKYAGMVSPAYEADRLRLASGEPLAYVIGTIPYLGLSIHLDSKPLIPRPETEWWTERLIQELKKRATPVRVLDLCAGSGAIGCAILKHVPAAHVSFGEIDATHKPTIQKNIDINGLDAARADVRIGDLFEPFPLQFDVIATNPPYVPEGRELERSVTDHEPALALFAGGSGLSVIERIVHDAHTHLLPQGELWIECDETHVEDVRTLVRAHAERAQVVHDQYDRARLVVGYF